MWYCDPFGDIQHMEPREILKHGKDVDYTQCRLRRRDDSEKAEAKDKDKRQVFD